MSRNLNRRRRAGLTLMEVLLVMAILVILASMAGVMITQVQKNAYKQAAANQVAELKQTVDLYHLEMREFPSQQDGLAALVYPPSNATNPGFWHQFLNKDVPLDPWGNQYRYMYPGVNVPEECDIWSAGPDGIDGTPDDIGNWQ